MCPCPKPQTRESFQLSRCVWWILVHPGASLPRLYRPLLEVASPCMVLESGQFLSRSTNTATCQELHWSWWVRGHGHCSSIKCPGWWEITLDLRWFCYSWVHAAKAKWGFVHLLLWIFRSQSVQPKHAKKVSWLLPAIFAFRMWYPEFFSKSRRLPIRWFCFSLVLDSITQMVLDGIRICRLSCFFAAWCHVWRAPLQQSRRHTGPEMKLTIYWHTVGHWSHGVIGLVWNLPDPMDHNLSLELTHQQSWTMM